MKLRLIQGDPAVAREHSRRATKLRLERAKLVALRAMVEQQAAKVAALETELAPSGALPEAG